MKEFTWGWEEDEIDLSKIRKEKEEIEVSDYSQQQYTGYVNNGANNENRDLHNSIAEKEELLTEEEKKILEKEIENRKNKEYKNNKKSKEVIMSSGMTVSEYIQERKKSRAKASKNRHLHLQKIRKKIKLESLEEAVEENRLSNKVAKQIVEKAKEKQRENKKEDYRRSFTNRKDNRLPANQKTLLKTLGITEDELYKAIGVHSTLTEKEKAMILSRGYFGTASVLKNTLSHKSYATLGDISILEFLYKFKIATVRQLAIAVNKNINTMYGQLNKMYNMGLVSRSIEGKVVGWTLTRSGMAVIKEDGSFPNVPKSSGKSEAFALSYVGACLFSNKINALNLSDFPYSGREFMGEKVQGEELVPERLIRSALMKDVSKIHGGLKRVRETANTDVAVRVEKLWQDWENKGRVGSSPDELEGNEHLFILYPLRTITSSYIIPDIVVRRPRENGKPKNIAIEVERQLKSLEEYKHKLRMYKLDERVYGKVVYVAKSNMIAERVQQAAEEVGFTRYDIVPFVNEDGPISVTDTQVL